jgi:hypothetical protein
MNLCNPYKYQSDEGSSNVANTVKPADFWWFTGFINQIMPSLPFIQMPALTARLKNIVALALPAVAVSAPLTLTVDIPIGAVPTESPLTGTVTHTGGMVNPYSTLVLSLPLVYPSAAVIAIEKVFRVYSPC